MSSFSSLNTTLIGYLKPGIEWVIDVPFIFLVKSRSFMTSFSEIPYNFILLFACREKIIFFFIYNILSVAYQTNPSFCILYSKSILFGIRNQKFGTEFITFHGSPILSSWLLPGISDPPDLSDAIAPTCSESMHQARYNEPSLPCHPAGFFHPFALPRPPQNQHPQSD